MSIIPTFSEVTTRSELCRNINGESESSFQHGWERMKPSITKVSLISTDWTKDIRSMKNFTYWVDESMSYFTFSRLQHSSISRSIDQTPLSDVNINYTIEEIDTTAPYVPGNNYTATGVIQRTDSYTSLRHIISGYHEDETSILVPIKLPLPSAAVQRRMKISPCFDYTFDC